MLLLIMCRYLEVADCRMTTAIKLVLAQAVVSGVTSLVHQLVRNRVLHRCPFPERGPSTLRLHLGSQLLLELFVLADAQASALPAHGFGTLGSQGTRVTRRRRELSMLAGDHGDALAPRTGHLHPRKVQGEIILREKRTNLWPGASDNVHALRRPSGNPWAGHVSQVDIELQQAGGFSNSSANSSTASCSGSFAGRTTTSRMTVLSKSTAKCSLKPLKVLALLLRPWRMSRSS